jgi:hypothetical protein
MNKLYREILPNVTNSFMGLYELLLKNNDLGLLIDVKDNKIQHIKKNELKQLISQSYKEDKKYILQINPQQHILASLKIAFLAFMNSAGYDISNHVNEDLTAVKNFIYTTQTFANYDNTFIRDIMIKSTNSLMERNSKLLVSIDMKKALNFPEYYIQFIEIAGLETASEYSFKAGLISHGLNHRLAAYELMSYMAKADLYNLYEIDHLTPIGFSTEPNESNCFLPRILGRTRSEIRNDFKSLAGDDGGCPALHFPDESTDHNIQKNGYHFNHTIAAILGYHINKFIVEELIPAISELYEENPEIVLNTIPHNELLLLSQRSATIDRELFLDRGLTIEQYNTEIETGNKHREKVIANYDNNRLFNQEDSSNRVI